MANYQSSIAGKMSMRTTMKKTIALILMTAVWLAGCSGRTDEEAAVDPNDPLVIAAAQAGIGQIRTLTTTPSLLTGSAESASIIAIVTDENNRAIDEQEVSFSSDGGVLQNIASTTLQSGEASAELNLAGDFRNGNISVTASIGSHEATTVASCEPILAVTLILPFRKSPARFNSCLLYTSPSPRDRQKYRMPSSA